MMSHGGARNMNIRKDVHKKCGVIKRAKHAARYKGLKEVLILQLSW
jgi:hypothetical protein